MAVAQSINLTTIMVQLIETLPVVGLSDAVQDQFPTNGPHTWVQRPEGWVGVSWGSQPTPDQESQAATIIQNWDPLVDAKNQKILALQAQIDAASDAAFNSQTQSMMNFLLTQAEKQNLMNRVAYLSQVGQWGADLYAVLLAAVAQVQAAPDKDTVNAVTMTLLTPPAVTLAGALAIPD